MADELNRPVALDPGRRRLLMILLVLVPLTVCGLLLCGYLAYVTHGYKSLFPVRMVGDWRLAADAQIGFVPAPNASTHRDHIRRGMSYEINNDSRGARVDLPDTRAPDQVDILAIGGSYTWGGGVESSQTFPSALARMTGARVYNVSYGSYGAVQALQMLRKHKDLKPKVVIYGYIADHLRRNLSPCAPSHSPFCLPVSYVDFDDKGLPFIHQPLSQYDAAFGQDFYRAMISDGFHLRDIYWGAKIILGKLQKKEFLAASRDGEDGARQAAHTHLLGEMLKETRAMGAMLMVVNIPYVGLTTPNHPSDDFVNAVKAFPSSKNPDFVVVDLYPPVLRHYRNPDALILGIPNDGHPNELGHLLIAKEIHAELKRRGFVH